MPVNATTSDQFSRLPLPAAHLVIDIRGAEDNRIIEWLQVELEDLTNEMKGRNVPRWRYLRDFLSLMSMNPFSDYAGHSGSEERAREGSLFSAEMRLLLDIEKMSGAFFEQKMNELIQEIERIRINRKVAMQDLLNATSPGRSSHDAMVRVIFLTDIGCRASLASAARCTEHLKNCYRKSEQPGRQPLLSTTVLCLGKSGEEGLQAALIKGLSRNNNWDHLDSLILSEDYHEESAFIESLPQQYIAELLLYVLLMIPPLPVNVPPGNLTPTAHQDEYAEQEIGLPAQTYVASLVALEYSAQWGRRWLNFGLAREFINVLRQKPDHLEQEKIALADIAINWFHSWYQQIQKAIPDSVPQEVTVLEGIQRARQVSMQGQPVFKVGQSIRKNAVEELENYLNRLVETYVTFTNEPALQDALTQGSFQIMQALRKKEHAPREKQRLNTLSKLQIEAKQVLGYPKFWSTASSLIESADLFLKPLDNTFANIQQKHLLNPLHPHSLNENMEGRKQDLQDKGQQMVNKLKKDISRWPCLTRYPFTKHIVQGITFPLLAFLTFIVAFLGITWLHHTFLENVPAFLSLVDSTVLGIPLLDLIAIVICFVLIPLEFLTLHSGFTRQGTNGLHVEINFLIPLALLALCGLLVSFSITVLTHSPNDTTSIFYLAWLSFMPTVGLIALLVLVFIVLTELLYYIWWSYQLRLKYQRIARSLYGQHKQDIQDVISFIAEDVALEMALRAEIYDRNGGSGAYSSRIAKLSRLLGPLAQDVQHQEQLAADRLLFNQSETRQSASSTQTSIWLNSYISNEELELEPLTDEHKELRQQIAQDRAVLRVQAEYILRAEGAETPEELEQEMREKLDEIDGDERSLQLLFMSLMALTIRFAIDPLPGKNIDLDKKDYQSARKYIDHEMPMLNALIQTFNQQISQVALQSSAGKHTVYDQLGSLFIDTNLLAHMFALRGQLFWQQKGSSRLKESLMLHGIFKHLELKMQNDYDPAAILRHLLGRAALFANALRAGQTVDLYLLMAPQSQDYQFRQGLRNLTLPRTIEFPDKERILLLGIKRFVAEPRVLSETATVQPQKTQTAPYPQMD